MGIRGFAVVLPMSYPPHDAISCAVPLPRLDHDHEASIVASLQRAAEDIRRLGVAGRLRGGSAGGADAPG